MATPTATRPIASAAWDLRGVPLPAVVELTAAGAGVRLGDEGE
jgi:hypothetical protein